MHRIQLLSKFTCFESILANHVKTRTHINYCVMVMNITQTTLDPNYTDSSFRALDLDISPHFYAYLKNKSKSRVLEGIR